MHSHDKHAPGLFLCHLTLEFDKEHICLFLGRQCALYFTYLSITFSFASLKPFLLFSSLQQVMTLSICSSRILSISPVPGSKLAGINTSNLEFDFKDTGGSINSTLRSNVSKSSGYNSDDNLRGNRRSVSSVSKVAREEIIAFDSSTDEEDMGEDSFAVSPSPPSFDGRLSPEGSSLGTAGSLDGDLSSEGREESDYNENESTDDEGKGRRRHDKKHIDESCPEVDEGESNQQPTVWMGTEDG